MKYIKITIKTNDDGNTQRNWCRLHLGPGSPGRTWYGRFVPNLLAWTQTDIPYDFYFASPIDATMFSLRWSK